MAIGDVYEVVSTFLYLGELAKNVYHYYQQAGSETSDAASCMAAWDQDVRPQVMAGMSDDCALIEMSAVNLMDGTDFDIASVSGIFGDIVTSSGTAAAAFMAWGWRFEQAYPGAPVGHKRYTGVSEDLTAGQVYILPAGVEAALKAALEAVIQYSTDTDIFKLVVVKRPFSLLAPPTVWFDVNTATYVNLTTQNSRK